MFFTFLNKENPDSLDFSVLDRYSPDKVLFYYYNSSLKIPVQYYISLTEENPSESPQKEWISFFEEELKIIEDVEAFLDNEYLEIIGPYYYPTTNTCFYFTKSKASEVITAEDLDILERLHQSPDIEKEVYTYYKARKNSKKSCKNKEELLKDINMCITSLKEIEILNRHINYLNKFMENRSSILEQEDLMPPEPDNLPPKPHKPEDTAQSKDNIIFFNFSKKNKAKNSEIYHKERKIYYIRYREYEKSCDRYKEVLKNWENFKHEFLKKCLNEVQEAELRAKNASRALDIYNTIIEKSFVHSDYQEVKTLETFKHYLETGRADNLQDCMNLFEEEKYWQEIRASQTRIENTIYFLQNASSSEYLEEDFKNLNTLTDKKLGN
ncbi:hypothetical protein [Thermosyntropha sp.]|uniref:hypothetical protein n=1 Tax=Thermosyntropha sp. TaxID=2740820 RepID=UPI0025E6504F|nr:hypothetical protein [Thermosyntropha sp.]MBO8158897.1 hypothetical protein [Thermosyntropha sp.]